MCSVVHFRLKWHVCHTKHSDFKTGDSITLFALNFQWKLINDSLLSVACYRIYVSSITCTFSDINHLWAKLRRSLYQIVWPLKISLHFMSTNLCSFPVPSTGTIQNQRGISEDWYGMQASNTEGQNSCHRLSFASSAHFILVSKFVLFFHCKISRTLIEF